MKTLAMCICIAAVLLTGCAPKFNRLNYDTVYVGAPRDKVIRAIGEPTRREGPPVETWIYVNEMPYYKGRITFTDGVVASKKFSFERPRKDSVEHHP